MAPSAGTGGPKVLFPLRTTHERLIEESGRGGIGMADKGDVVVGSVCRIEGRVTHARYVDAD